MCSSRKKSFLRGSQKGQGIMEYMIIASLVGIACLAVMRGFGEVVRDRIRFMKSEIVRNIEIK